MRFKSNKKTFCNHCGRQIAAQDEVCPYCGAAVSGAPDVSFAAQSRAAHRSGCKRWVFGVALAVALVGVIGCAVLAMPVLMDKFAPEKATYGAAEQLKIDRSAELAFNDANGEPLSGGVVEIWPLDPPDSLTWDSMRIELDENGEVSFKNNKEVPNGTYEMWAFSSHDQEQAYVCPDIQIEDLQNASCRVVFDVEDKGSQSALCKVPKFNVSYEKLPVRVYASQDGGSYSFSGDWDYVQIERNPGSKSVDAINEHISEAVNDEAKQAESWNASAGTSQCVWQSQFVPYIDEHHEIASVVTTRELCSYQNREYVTKTRVTGTLYDLVSGEPIKLSDFFSLSRDEMEQAGSKALNRFLSAKSITCDDKTKKKIIEDDARYYPGRRGLALAVSPDEIGTDGTNKLEILVIPYPNPSYRTKYAKYVGTDVSTLLE